MKTIHLNFNKLSSRETVRYEGSRSNGNHGAYTIMLFQSVPVDDPGCVEIHMSLEALMQLRTRIDAAMQHMITH